MEQIEFSEITDCIIAIRPMFYKAFGKHTPMSPSLTPGAYYVMLQLEKDGVLTMSDLGKKLYIPKPNVTTLVDKLISKGFVERLSDKTDRRIVRIRLTRKGSQFIEKNMKMFREQIRLRLTSLSNKELDVFSKSLKSIKEILLKIQVED